jgi:hypothetical protein
MGEKIFIHDLDSTNRMHAFIKTVGGKVMSFAVKLVCVIDDREVEVLRFDSGHEMPHVDHLNTKGEVVQKEWLKYLSNEQALTIALSDIKKNYQRHRERFVAWQGKEKRKSRRQTQFVGRGKTSKRI